jgi:pimeloyl-ACP methyl ester carboxylesterase
VTPPKQTRTPAAGIGATKTSAKTFPGSGRFRFEDKERLLPSLRVWYHRPAGLSEEAPVVFVMHGTNRDADVYRDRWRVAAERFGFVLVCPRFRRSDFGRGTYQLGRMVDREGVRQPKRSWAFNVVEELFDHVRCETGNKSERYHIYGHSAGGQFVHRLAMFMPDARFETAVAANSGWYTMPTFDEGFPYGLRGSLGGEGLEKVLGRSLVILLGERDTDSNDPYLRITPEALRQGKNRLDRGRNFHAAAEREAERLGARFGWRLITVPGASHLDNSMMPSALREIFPEGG